jgi:hypothetical protein
MRVWVWDDNFGNQGASRYLSGVRRALPDFRPEGDVTRATGHYQSPGLFLDLTPPEGTCPEGLPRRTALYRWAAHWSRCHLLPSALAGSSGFRVCLCDCLRFSVAWSVTSSLTHFCSWFSGNVSAAAFNCLALTPSPPKSTTESSNSDSGRAFNWSEFSAIDLRLEQDNSHSRLNNLHQFTGEILVHWHQMKRILFGLISPWVNWYKSHRTWATWFIIDN